MPSPTFTPVLEGESATYNVATTAFSRVVAPVFNTPNLQLASAELIIYGAGLFTFPSGTGANLTKVSVKLTDSSDTQLALYEVPLTANTQDILRTDIVIMLPTKAAGIRQSRCLFKLADLVGDGTAGTSYTCLATSAAFDWPADGIVYMSFGQTGVATSVFSVIDVYSSAEKIVDVA